ncbi:MAG: hypothetical protein H6Q90_5677 [Deltaproteobacteria bacterium]|nr:hypothetical protein [Deltaproteobacteria bacterium]
MTIARRHLAIAIAAFWLAPAPARADAQAEAVALFDQGIKDMEAGKFAEACKELEASLARYPDSGTKGALAECTTRLGRVASAWRRWRDLADTAPDTDLRADAAANAARLEPRLPRFVIKLQGAAPAGLQVTLDQTPADPTISIPLPIDPGPIVVVAQAPGYRPWTQTLRAVEGQVTMIEIPTLAALAAPAAPAAPVAPLAPLASSSSGGEPRDTSTTRHGRRVLGLSIGIGGLAAIGVGAVFGKRASSRWEAANATCGGSVDTCPDATVAAAQADVDATRSNGRIATALIGAGGAAVVTGAILWLTAPAAMSSSHALRVTPTVGGGIAGAMLVGRF